MGNYKGTRNKVQVFNPRSKRWALLDTKLGSILSYRKKPYKNVPIKGKGNTEITIKETTMGHGMTVTGV